VPAGSLFLEGAGAAARERVAAVLAGLCGQLRLLLLPAFPVTSQQGAEVLVCTVW